jgi:hypothetical protein
VWNGDDLACVYDGDVTADLIDALGACAPAYKRHDTPNDAVFLGPAPMQGDPAKSDVVFNADPLTAADGSNNGYAIAVRAYVDDGAVHTLARFTVFRNGMQPPRSNE